MNIPPGGLKYMVNGKFTKLNKRDSGNRQITKISYKKTNLPLGCASIWSSKIASPPRTSSSKYSSSSISENITDDLFAKERGSSESVKER